MGPEDVVIITADHGCDPADHHHTDHTREYIPYLAYGQNIEQKNYGTQPTFAAIAATIADYLGVPYECRGAVLK